MLLSWLAVAMPLPLFSRLAQSWSCLGDDDASLNDVSLLQTDLRLRSEHPLSNEAQNNLTKALSALQTQASFLKRGGPVNLKQYKMMPGFVDLYVNPDSDLDVLMDFTTVFHMAGDADVMITSMASEGYSDDEGNTLFDLHQPLEETENTIFKFELSHDKTIVKVTSPLMTLRTSDPGMKEAAQRGAQNIWFDELAVVATNKAGRIIVDGIELLAKGFFVSPQLLSLAKTCSIDNVASYPRNFDFAVTCTAPPSRFSVGFSVLKLPEIPMVPRVADDRIGYFTIDYKDLGMHRKDNQTLFVKRDVDTQVSLISKYNLQALSGQQIKFYIDPTVPTRWRHIFKEGIEAWNFAFAEIGHPNAMRGVLPSDWDWPPDYSPSDVRFNTISWSIDATSVSSEGVPKVDPRSGEILKSDIIMGDGWVEAYLTDLHTDAPDAPAKSAMLTTKKLAIQKARKAVAHLKQSLQDSSRNSDGIAPERSALNIHRRPALLQTQPQAKSVDRVQNLLDHPRGEVLLTRTLGMDHEAIMETGLRSIVMHEVGHTLGLRHNFKGSTGISFECMRNRSCTQVHGTSTSVMDYIPANIPSDQNLTEVDVWTPVLGAYDKLAIHFGYMELPAGVEPSLSEGPGLTPPTQLNEVLKEAEKYGLCMDEDEDLGKDPECKLYDLTASPLEFWGDQLKLIVKLQKTLLQNSVEPGFSYSAYGDAELAMLSKLSRITKELVTWIGGVNMSYAHRDTMGPMGTAAVQGIPRELQEEALAMLLKCLRPRTNDLLPPSETWKYLLVASNSDTGSRDFLDLEHVVQRIQHGALKNLLAASNLEQIASTSNLGGMSVGYFLSELVLSVFGDPDGTQLMQEQDENEYNVRVSIAEMLINLSMMPNQDLSSSIAVQVDAAMNFAKDTVNSAMIRLGERKPLQWGHCAHEGRTCACNGRVRFGVKTKSLWSQTLLSTSAINCSTSVFGDPAQHVRKTCQCLHDQSIGQDQTRIQLIRLKNIVQPERDQESYAASFHSRVSGALLGFLAIHLCSLG